MEEGPVGEVFGGPCFPSADACFLEDVRCDAPGSFTALGGGVLVRQGQDFGDVHGGIHTVA
uniref:Uncharacterized protein n=1 Tax=viral metagenome TaxID=1070528 RepID=A0A6H1ZGX6_9ZZZZ